MNINNNHGKINFGHKFETYKVLEVTTQKILKSEALAGPKEVISILSEKDISKGIGNRGYKHLAMIIGEKITQKYPQIKRTTEEIKKIIKENPKISKSELYNKSQLIINSLGNEIDITI